MTHPLLGPRAGLAAALALALTGALAAPAAAAPLENRQVIALWPGDAPGTKPDTTTPQILERSKTLFQPDRALVGVVQPTLTAILPDNPNGTSVIVAPGGAYARVVLDKEGQEIVDWLRPLGVTVFLMTYRLPAEGHENGADAPLQDGQRAVRLVRQNAADWGLDPARIGFLGFSAAGHLGASLATGFGREVHAPLDAADALSARPDFVMLGYPVISMEDGVTHAESRKNLIGEDPTPERIAAYSPDRQVTDQTPQTFLFAADDDPAVPSLNAVRLYTALHEAGVPTELHIFKEGGHGFGIERAAGLPAGRWWPPLARDWMTRIGMLD
jgi:acetyl esterase/lipase